MGDKFDAMCIKSCDVAGRPRWFGLYVQKEDTRPFAYVAITETANLDPNISEFEKAMYQEGKKVVPLQAMIWMIYVATNARRQGHGRALINFLKTKYSRICSQVGSREGMHLMKACGMKFVAGSAESGTDMYVWEQEIKEAESAGKSS